MCYAKLAYIVHTSSDRCVPNVIIRKFIELLETPKAQLTTT
nr:MAG TPA: hypothetical protein [Caudoviricetes sp.]